MTIDPDHTPSSTRRILLLLLACVLALALPFMVMRAIAPRPASSADPAGVAALVAGSAAATAPRGTSTNRPTARTATTGRTATATGATSTSAPSSTTSTSAASSSTSGPAGGTEALAADAEACRLANLRQQSPLSAAAVSLAQFDKHIDAMNLLVAGKITLAVATTFWDQTRVGAAQNAAAFRSADKQLTAATSTCRPPDPSVAYSTPYGQLLAISGCANAIKARTTELARARAAVTTWEHHIHDMEMLRTGHITPAQATAAWSKNWRTGAGQLAAYDAAAAAAAKLHCSLD
ncbi:hypothetical protein [Pedococcus sp. 2YAF34]|uniref:hypothetical protein n=1 Tax=Pedococcus sp. 2YAF34 TaxID=3233032 RepID=UPI003F9DE0C0